MSAKDLDSLVAKILSRRTNKATHVCTKDDIKCICDKAKCLFLSEASLLELQGPIVVVGDIHGHMKALIRVFAMNGLPPKTKYLFLGDYVDRGSDGVEVMLVLLCLKLRYPDNVFLLRGNHECAEMTELFGFRDECLAKYDMSVWSSFVSVFLTLPVAAVVDQNHFCVHGGLSPYLCFLDDVRAITRPLDSSENQMVHDMVWTDPSRDTIAWGRGTDRGDTRTWGENAATLFLGANGLKTIIRGHQTAIDGFAYPFEPSRHTITIFSIAKYLPHTKNKAAVATIDANSLVKCEIVPSDRVKLKFRKRR